MLASWSKVYTKGIHNANKQFIMAAIAYNLKTCLPQAGVPEVRKQENTIRDKGVQIFIKKLVFYTNEPISRSGKHEATNKKLFSQF